MSDYEGNERRHDKIDRDRLLTEIHVNLQNLVKNFDTHIITDEKNFSTAKKDVDWLKKVAYVGIGGFMVFEFVLKFIK